MTPIISKNKARERLTNPTLPSLDGTAIKKIQRKLAVAPWLSAGNGSY
jgi:hypothetical protein